MVLLRAIDRSLAPWRLAMNLVARQLAGCLLVTALAAAPAAAQLPEVQLTIDGHALSAEVAATTETRSQGLMHRRMLPENRGMLFEYAAPDYRRFWMRNCRIPIDVAYINKDTVEEIHAMKAALCSRLRISST